jgi:hypothetical protein
VTITICPDCKSDLIDETDLCGMCSETFESYCDCVRYEQCDECADDEDRCCRGMDDVCVASGCLRGIPGGERG